MGSLKWEVKSAKGHKSTGRRPGAFPVPSDFKLQTSNFKPGFNLIETLVASAILSGSVLALGAISTNALTETRLNRHYEVAAMLIERHLNAIDLAGIDQFIEADQTEGVFEEFEPGYHWQVSTEYRGTDNLYLVTITVTWVERKRPYQVTVHTMLNGTGLTLTTTEPTTQ